MNELRGRLKWLMSLRVVAVTLLLGLAIAFQIVQGELVLAYYAMIVLTYAITIGYAFILTHLTSAVALTHFAYLQIGVDLLLETFLVIRTGIIDSPFPVLYIITIALAGLILRRWGSLMTAGVSVILFGLMTNIQLYELVESVSWFQRSGLSVGETFQIFGTHALAFIVVGYLSGTVAEQLERADQSLVEKERGLSRLRAFHENVVQSISSGVFTTDPEGRITSFNRAAQEATGYAVEAVRGWPWWICLASRTVTRPPRPSRRSADTWR